MLKLYLMLVILLPVYSFTKSINLYEKTFYNVNVSYGTNPQLNLMYQRPLYRKSIFKSIQLGIDYTVPLFQSMPEKNRFIIYSNIPFLIPGTVQDIEGWYKSINRYFELGFNFKYLRLPGFRFQFGTGMLFKERAFYVKQSVQTYFLILGGSVAI